MKEIITFNKYYQKLKIPTLSISEPCVYTEKAILIDVHVVNKTSEIFHVYDTANDLEEIPKDFSEETQLLLIFFDTDYDHVFITLRKDDKENRIKYFKNIGQEFSVEIREIRINKISKFSINQKFRNAGEQ